MKSALAIIFLLLPAGLLAQDVWVQRDSINGPGRTSAVSFSMNFEAWIATGYDGEDDKRRMYSYDPGQDDWDDEESLGGVSGSGLQRKSAVGFSIKGYGYVALGTGIPAFYKDLWRYDDVTKVWTQMADFAGTARSEAVAFAIDSVAYVGSGKDEDGPRGDFFAYDQPTNTWTAISDCPGDPRREAVGFTMGGKGYFGTGVGSSGMLNDFWEYYPPTDTWDQKADFPSTPREGAVGVAVFPQAFIMLGYDNTLNYKDDVWEYNYFGDNWTQRTDFPGGPRTQAIATKIVDRIYVRTGYNGTYLDDFWEYQQILVTDGLAVEKVKVFPNPTSGIISINLPSSYLFGEYQIYSAAGQIVCSGSVHSTQLECDLSSFTKGHYYVSLTSANRSEARTKKIILQ